MRSFLDIEIENYLASVVACGSNDGMTVEEAVVWLNGENLELNLEYETLNIGIVLGLYTAYKVANDGEPHAKFDGLINYLQGTVRS